MKEKIIQGGIVNGEKMLVCPTWEDEFQKAINSTDRKSTRLNSSHITRSRMPSSA